jgi:hypothetical protein
MVRRNQPVFQKGLDQDATHFPGAKNGQTVLEDMLRHRYLRGQRKLKICSAEWLGAAEAILPSKQVRTETQSRWIGYKVWIGRKKSAANPEVCRGR